MDQRQLFLRHVAQTSPSPLALEIVRASGCTMWDVHGNTYLDLIAGISVCNVGHCHPSVTGAIREQCDRYLHLLVYGELVQSPQVQYAQLLAAMLPEPLDSVYFTSSGTEATEGAMKLAKRVTGRTKIVAFNDSYHGSTQGALSVVGDEYWRNAYRPLLPGIVHIEYGSMALLDEIDEQTACVIAETVQAERGVRVPSGVWMQALRERCSQTGALLVLDEIQVGFGRTGHLWAFERFDIVPDILLLGKALGGGMPLGAFIASPQHMQALTHEPVLGHITTFGGHPVSCAAGMAAMKVLLETGLIDDVERKLELFRYTFHPALRERLRASGLLMAIEFDDFETNRRIIERSIERGLLTDWFLFAPQCMRLAPPLVISDEEIVRACDIIWEACESVLY